MLILKTLTIQWRWRFSSSLIDKYCWLNFLWPLFIFLIHLIYFNFSLCHPILKHFKTFIIKTFLGMLSLFTLNPTNYGLHNMHLYEPNFWNSVNEELKSSSAFSIKLELNLRRILRIRWQQRITNERILKISGMENVSCEVRRNWLGYILRREESKDCKSAIGWQPEGKRARG